MKRTLIIISTILLVLISYPIYKYFNPTTTELSTQIGLTQKTQLQHSISPITTGLIVPRSLIFTSQDRILVTERPGRIREIINGNLNPTPLLTIPEISIRSEEGLMSIIKDPNYEDNKYIYISYAYPTNNEIKVKIQRLTDQGNELTNPTTIIDNLPAAQRHAGTALGFGPDGKLYITVGDATQGEKSQFRDFYNGKILRINPDGTIPSDNPFPGYATRVLGLRNSQGITWDLSGNMYAIDHGPSIFDGPAGGDEINLIIKGGNYGRPVVSHEKTEEGMIDPIAIFTPAIAPASITIYYGSKFPERNGNLLIGMLRGEGILRVSIDPHNPGKILEKEIIVGKQYGRIRNVKVGPDGKIYFTTSNEDGRGKSSIQQDGIYKISPY